MRPCATGYRGPEIRPNREFLLRLPLKAYSSRSQLEGVDIAGHSLRPRHAALIRPKYTRGSIDCRAPHDERVGGVIPFSVDVRVIAATNRDLELSIKEGRFREDLYHRLNVVAITLPPLRERKEDIPALASYFLRQCSTASRRSVNEITEETMAKLTAYDWPGNVRELANVIERSVVLGLGSAVVAEDLPGRIADGVSAISSEIPSYRDGLTEARKQMVLKALAKTNGNRAAAAKLLGLESKYLLKLMKTLRIE